MLANNVVRAKAKVGFSAIESQLAMPRIRTMFAARARLAGLTTLARLRLLGPLPWLLFALWGTAATLEEPHVLRSFGIRLQEQAIWAAASVLVVMLLLPRAVCTRDHLARITSNLAIVLGIGIAQACLSYGLEQALGYAGDSRYNSQGMVCFWFAGMPTAIALATPSEAGTAQVFFQKMFMAGALVTSMVLGVHFGSGGLEWPGILASCLSATGCLLLAMSTTVTT